ncbi:MAG: hypothetical protein ACK5HT_19865 [Draconibacterium sp.]
MKKLQVEVDYSDKNYFAGTGEIGGVVMATHKTLEGLKDEFASALQFHIEGCVADGDELPEWATSGDYEIEFILSVQALLHHFNGVLTREALSRVTGINARQLGHYMSGYRQPREDKRLKIIEGIHQIGKELSSVV